MVPIVASVADLPAAIAYAQDRPQSRWYVSRRAHAFEAADQIPAEWGDAITAASGAPSTDEMAALGKKGQALRNEDGSYSYPTRNRGELAKAFQAYGRARNKVAAKRYLLRRARSLHATDLIPDSWKPLRAAAAPADEVNLWVSQVRELLTSAGLDPDEVEADTDGFETDYRQYQDNPQGYVDELIAASQEPDDEDETTDDETADEPVTEPEATVAPAPAVPMPVAAATYTSGNLNPASVTQIFTASPPGQVPPQFDMDTLVAAIKAASKDAAAEVLVEALKTAGPVGLTIDGKSMAAAAKKPLVDDTTSAPLPPEDAALVPDDMTADVPARPDAPVDVDAAKTALRDRFGSKPKKKAKPAPVDAVPVPVTAAVLRERIAARSAS